MKNEIEGLIGTWESKQLHSYHGQQNYLLRFFRANGLVEGEMTAIDSINFEGLQKDRLSTIAHGRVEFTNREEASTSAFDSSSKTMKLIIGEETFELVLVFDEAGKQNLEFLSGLKGSPILFQRQEKD